MSKTEKETVVNYSEDQIEQLKALYAEKGNDGLNEIAAAIGKTRKSIIGKLINLKIYVKINKTPKALKVEGPSKKELLKTFADVSGVDVTGLEHATKNALSNLIAFANKAKAA